MSAAYLIGCLVASIVAILFIIMKLKMNPALALVIGALIMGFSTDMDALELVSGINNGFGGMLGSIGFPIGFGIILGQLLSDSGGANIIADRLVRLFPASKAVYAVALAAFILSIPVFFDVTFVIIIPIGVALMKKINKPIPYIVGSIAIGAGVAHTLVPPTPNPLAAAEIFGFDLGYMILGGLIVGLVIVVIAVTIYCKILDRGLWNKEKDETGLGIALEEQKPLPEKAPGFALALVPVFLPVVLIIVNTIVDIYMGDGTPIFVKFLGTKSMSMLLGALAAYAIAVRAIGGKATEISAAKALESAGMVFLITGAGGSFAKIVEMAGINNAIVGMVHDVSPSLVVVLIISYVLGLLFRQITGSGTVASLTTMGIMASVAPAVDIHPVFIALACLDGALFGATVNDSGFWIVANMSGLKFTGGVKTYTLGQAIASVIGIVVIIAGALLFSAL